MEFYFFSVHPIRFFPGQVPMRFPDTLDLLDYSTLPPPLDLTQMTAHQSNILQSLHVFPAKRCRSKIDGRGQVKASQLPPELTRTPVRVKRTTELECSVLHSYPFCLIFLFL